MVELSSYFSTQSANAQDILKLLESQGITALHATNGVYGAPLGTLLPTTVAGFQYIHDTYPDKNEAFLVAVNSDKSVADADGDTSQNQRARMAKVVPWLATQFQGRRVIGVFYDEQDPVALYASLHAAGIEMRSLHKWGYGATPGAKAILGAEFFETVYGFPFASSTSHITPAFWHLTPEGQKGKVDIINLVKTYGHHRRPYLSDDNKLLFPVVPALAAYAATPTPPDNTSKNTI